MPFDKLLSSLSKGYLRQYTQTKQQKHYIFIFLYYIYKMSYKKPKLLEIEQG